MDAHAPLTSIDEVRAVVHAAALGDTAVAGRDRPDRIGLETEFFAVRASRDGVPAGRATLAEVGALLDDSGWVRPAARPDGLPAWALRDGSLLVPEPGGQIEHAGLPEPTAAAVAAAGRQAASALAGILEPHGIVLVSAGLDRWHDPGTVAQQLTVPRYPAMHAYLAARSPHGHVMMCHTCSLQINLDLGAGSERTRRWQVTQLAAPLAVATFACSPVPGAVNGRALVWSGVDPTRTGIPAAFVGGCDDPGETLTAAALAADVLLVVRGGRAEPGMPGWTFGDWLAGGSVLYGRPTAADLRYHLTTLFSEVRTRGFLEIRSVDALPARWRCVPVILYAGLVYDPVARDHALAVLERHRGRLPLLLRRAAQLGVADPELCALAVEVWTLAAEGAARLPAGYVDPADLRRTHRYLDTYTLRGRSPSDELRERAAVGPAATLAWAAEPAGTLSLC